MTQLYLIEQELARRVGPFYQDVAAAGSANGVTITSLSSTLGLGDRWTGVGYLLRRGFLSNAPPAVGGFLASDRVRRVAAYNVSTGTLTPDRAWTNAPVAGETIELHYLEPSLELRDAAQDGLMRCFYVDRGQMTPSVLAAERDITQAVPWITQLGQLYEVEWTYPGLIYVPRPVVWWFEFIKFGHVWLRAWPDPLPNTLLLTARRPCGTAVNTAAQQLAAVATVSAATNAAPIQITAAGHGFASGAYVQVAGVGGNLAANGTWLIAVVDVNTFTLTGSKGNGVYVSGGTATLSDYATEPTNDTDDCPATLDYAAAMAHVEAWKHVAAKLIGPAQLGLTATLAEASAEATARYLANFKPQVKREQLPYPFPNWSTARA